MTQRLQSYSMITLSIVCTTFLSRPLAGREKSRYDIAVYYWPNYHPDAYTEGKLGKGWSEWEVVKAATPWFPGHHQPHVPLWGYRDEANPAEMARTIDAMADNGITAILFDWYRFDSGGILDAALDSGFLKAANRGRLKFALMWANQDFQGVYGANSGAQGIWFHGAVTRQTFDRIADEAVHKYFSEPNYWRIDGKPVFSIYQLQDLIVSLGGLRQTRDALEDFRARARAAGFPGVHLDVIGFGLWEAMVAARGGKVTTTRTGLPIQSEADLLAYLGADSVTWYTWTHVASPECPSEDYNHWAERSVALWAPWQSDVKVPFYPNVSQGWDGSPRDYETGIVTGNSPDLFRKYLQRAKEYLDKQPTNRRILTVNSWNEWAEGSYLEPDTVNGMKYLAAIREVFGSN